MHFGREVFQYLVEIVPYWRVSDDAWMLSDGSYLTGIGVLRNFGGNVLVVPFSTNDTELSERLTKISDGELTVWAGNQRIEVVIDDRQGSDSGAVSRQLAGLTVVCWSHRKDLVRFVVKDTRD